MWSSPPAVHSEGCRLRQLRTPASATLSLQTEVQSTRLTPKNVFTKTAFLMRQQQRVAIARVHMDAFINGCGYSPYKCLEDAKELKMPPSIKEYIMTTRKRVNDITEMMRENNYHMQKMTINFPKDVDDNYYCRDEVFEHLKKIPEITLVSGGYGNLEFTKAGVDKGVALHKLAQILNIAADETMAVGDTENDMAIVKAAHIGVAMGNATDELKAQADYVTDTNENDGVAKAIRHFMG